MGGQGRGGGQGHGLGGEFGGGRGIRRERLHVSVWGQGEGGR